MAKSRTHYMCRECGTVQNRWLGKCPDCNAWDALERFNEPLAASASTQHAAMAGAWLRGDDAVAVAPATSIAIPLPELEAADVDRLPTGIGEFDRVLGGGLVPGSVILVGGDPGIGKSTLLLQAAAQLSSAGRTILYVSSEESAYQTRLRAERLFPERTFDTGANPDNGRPLSGDALERYRDLYVLAETNLARIVEQARKVQPAVLVLDSVQMVFKADLESAPGSIAQLRRCCTELVYLAKVSGMTVVLVGHVTKDGQLAGPKLLEHLVDAVLSFEGDRHHAHRVVRGIKNRFGTTLEVGLFEMTGRGLREVTDVGALADPDRAPAPGTVVCPVMQGTRCLAVEIQALTATGFLGSAKRRTSGLDPNRLAMLIAVLEQHGGLRLADQDVFASTVGGLKIVEPAADLALCLAIAGAHYRKHVPAALAAIGEVGLGGEIRPAHRLEQRLREATRLGYERVVTGRLSADGAAGEAHLLQMSTISEALGLLES